MGNPEKECEYFERAIAAKTDYADGLQSLAEVLYYRLSERERAGILQDLVNAQDNTFVVENTYASETELGDICYKYGNYAWAKSKYGAAARIVQRETSNTTSKFKRRVLGNQVVYTKVHAAMAAYKSGMADQAQEIIDGLGVDYPEHPLIPYGRGQLALLRGDMDTATAAFKASMEQDSRFRAAPMALGEYYLSQGFVDEAVALWKEFLKTSTENRHVRRCLKAVRAHTDTSKTNAEV